MYSLGTLLFLDYFFSFVPNSLSFVCIALLKNKGKKFNHNIHTGMYISKVL